MSTQPEKSGGGTWTLEGVTRPPESTKPQASEKARKFRLIVIAGLLVLVFSIAFMNIGRENARANECIRHGQTIARAIAQFRDRNGFYPPAYTVDHQGRPLHSWRVLLLPYLGKNDLSMQIRHDEPWDSAFNQQFHHQMPVEFGCSGTLERRRGNTHWQVIVGPDTVFPPPGRIPRRLEDIARPSNSVILLTEATPAVPWMAPHDVRIDQLQNAGGTHGDSFVIVMLNGTAEIVHKPDMTPEQLRTMATVR